MSILKVARMGHPVLRARAKALDAAEIKSARVQQLIDDMFETMEEYQGVGLAAPQVHASVRLFVAGFAPRPHADPDDDDADDDDTDEDDEDARAADGRSSIPKSTIVGNETVDDWEGCLSIPEIRGRVHACARDQGARLRSERAPHRDHAPAASPRASSSTRPITSTACCSWIGWSRSRR